MMWFWVKHWIHHLPDNTELMCYELFHGHGLNIYTYIYWYSCNKVKRLQKRVKNSVNHICTSYKFVREIFTNNINLSILNKGWEKMDNKMLFDICYFQNKVWMIMNLEIIWILEPKLPLANRIICLPMKKWTDGQIM